MRPSSSPRTTSARRSRTAKTIPPSRGARSSCCTPRASPPTDAGPSRPRARRLEDALELAVDDPDRALVEIALARLDMTEAALDRGLRAPRRRRGQARPRRRPAALGRARVRSRVSWLSGRWDEALTSATEAVSALDGLPESPQLARALARLSQIQMLKQQPQSIETAERAIDVARRVGDPFAEVNARINIFTQRSTAGVAPDPDERALDHRLGGRGRRIRGGVPGDREPDLVEHGLPARRSASRSSSPRRERGSRTFRRRGRSAPTSTSRS